MKCPHCGQEHSNQATYCPVTGNQIVAFECPNCGQVVMTGTAFCPYCGFNLAGAPVAPRQRWLWVLLASAGVFLALLALVFFLTVRVPIGSSGGNLPAPSPTSRLGQVTGSQTPAPDPVVTSPAPPNQSTPATPSPSPLALSQKPPDCMSIGQIWTRPADSMPMVCVPAGSFTIGMKTCEFNGCVQEVNGGSVNLESYWIDQTEVTNAMFALFVTQTGFITGAERTGASEVNGISRPVKGADWRHPQGPGSSIGGQDNYPVVQMDWYAGAAYCIWSGGRLPTEAQWEKAARGTDGRLFPWGNAMPDDRLLNAADSSLPVPWAQADQNDGYRYTAPVGSFPAGNSPYGAEDMAGNAWEWTRSLYRPFPYIPGDGREIQTSPAAGDRVVLRGGGFYSDYGSVRSTLRYGGVPDLTSDAIGFRCAYP